MSKSKSICKTKYPIILIHGIGNRDYRHLNYWGNIPKLLEYHGAKVFYGNQEACKTIEENAKILKKNILKIIKANKYEKVNLIAHSKGGLEARYMIAKLNMDKYVASLTTISTPHLGSKTMDIFCEFPECVYRFISNCGNLYFKILGDTNPDFYNTVRQLTTKYCNNFNLSVKNSNNVYYQSYSSIMSGPFSDIGMFFSYIIVYIIEGQNDGLVTLTSAKWDNFKLAPKNKGIRGISHCDIVDSKRLNRVKVDMKKFYIDIIKDLRCKGL